MYYCHSEWELEVTNFILFEIFTFILWPHSLAIRLKDVDPWHDGLHTLFLLILTSGKSGLMPRIFIPFLCRITYNYQTSILSLHGPVLLLGKQVTGCIQSQRNALPCLGYCAQELTSTKPSFHSIMDGTFNFYKCTLT